MKNPLNKARIPENKAHEPIGKTAGPVLTNPDLQKIVDLAAEVQQTDPETLEGIKKGLAQAQAAQEAAAKAKEEAETETEFNKACDDAIRAREKESFFRRLLNKYRYTPRMNDEEYDAAVDSVAAVVNEAAEEYRAAAEKHVAALIQARQDYIQTITEADRALSALDDAANVLQVRFRYREMNYTGMAPQLIDDPNEWRKHATRYNDSQKRAGVNLVMVEPSEHGFAKYNEVIREAWYLAVRLTGKREEE